MGGPNRGGNFGRRLIFFCVTSLLLLATVLEAPSAGADITLSSKTYFLYYKRDLAGGESQRFAPLYEYLSGDANGIGGAAVSFHFYGWGRQDLGDDTGSGPTSGELGSAYLQYLHPTGNAEVRLGRFFLTEGTAKEIVDGIFLKARTGIGFGASVFGGAPAEATITATESGDSIVGGRVFYARPGFTEIGISYLQEKGEFQGHDRKEIGGDLWLRPFGPVELVGRVAYNDATRAMAYERYLVRLRPFASLDLSGGYEAYKYKDYFQTALNPAFLSPAIDNTDRVRSVFATLDWEAVKGVTITVGGKSIRHDSLSIGDATRGELGVKYAYNGNRDAAGVSAAVVSADLDQDSYREIRGYVTYSPAKWRFTLDAMADLYDQEINGTKKAYYVVGSAGYRLFEVLQLTGDLTYTKSPQFEKDYAGLLRVTLELAGSTGTQQGKPKPAPEAPAPEPAEKPAARSAPEPAPAPVAPAPVSPVAPAAQAAPEATTGGVTAGKAGGGAAPVPAMPKAPVGAAPSAASNSLDTLSVSEYLDRMAADLRAKFPGAVVARREDIVEVTLPSGLLFRSGSDVVNPAALPSLKAAAEILNRYPNTLVTVEGHSDSSGNPESNQELSEKRARSVFDLLVKDGVYAMRISMRGYGDRNPVADNSTPEGRRANRRVQMKIRPDGILKARQGQGR